MTAGHLDCLDLLLQAGANPHTQDNMGITPSHLAAGEGHRSAIQALLTAGADMTVVDSQGLSPLSCAVLQGRSVVVRWLLDSQPLLRGEAAGRNGRGSNR